MADETPRLDLGRTVVRLGRQVELALDEVELSVAQYRALLQLAEGAEASTALARKLAVDAPSVTAVVDGLVQRGAVERSTGLEDRRMVSLALTVNGLGLLSQANALVTDRLEQIALESGDDNRAQRAVNGLLLWRSALDAYRSKRLLFRQARVEVHR